MRFANSLFWLHRALWLCINNAGSWKKSWLSVQLAWNTNYIMLAIYWRNESGSPWRSIDWVWEQCNREGAMWQKAKWQRHVEPIQECTVLAIITETNEGIFRGERKIHTLCPIEMIACDIKLNNVTWQCSLCSTIQIYEYSWQREVKHLKLNIIHSVYR